MKGRDTLTRRALLAAPLAAPLARAAAAQSAAPGKMLLAIHQNTSRAAGFRGSLEGWARAGIRYVELSDGLLDGFLERDSLAAAGRVLADLGLTPVSAPSCCRTSGSRGRSGPRRWIPGAAAASSSPSWAWRRFTRRRSPPGL